MTISWGALLQGCQTLAGSAPLLLVFSLSVCHPGLLWATALHSCSMLQVADSLRAHQEGCLL